MTNRELLNAVHACPVQQQSRLRRRLAVAQIGPHDWRIGIGPQTCINVTGTDESANRSMRALADDAVVTDQRLLDPLRECGVLVSGRSQRTTDRVGANDCDASGLLGRRHPDRSRVSVRVVGSNVAAAAIAHTLGAAGVGTVLVDAQTRPVTAADAAASTFCDEDIGRSWCDVVTSRLRSMGCATAPSGDPNLVVLTACPDADIAVIDPAVGSPWLHAEIAHLPVLVAGLRAQVGPLVRPGVGPCLDCAVLMMTDHDPQWPAILAQLRHRVDRPCEPSGLTAAAVGIGSAVALEALDTRHDAPVSQVSEIITVDLPGAVPRPTMLRIHPSCGCGWKAEPRTMVR